VKSLTDYEMYWCIEGFGGGNQGGKRLLGRYMHRWEDNIKVGLKEIVWWVWVGLMWLIICTSGWL
jgi:hypothetical protein